MKLFRLRALCLSLFIASLGGCFLGNGGGYTGSAEDDQGSSFGEVPVLRCRFEESGDTNHFVIFRIRDGRFKGVLSEGPTEALAVQEFLELLTSSDAGSITYFSNDDELIIARPDPNVSQGLAASVRWKRANGTTLDREDLLCDVDD